MIYESSSVATAFDRVASSYDDEFEALPATKRLRRRIWDMYYRYFRPGETLLELNCGTGTDAIELASNGIRVVATDASAEMIAVTSRKIRGTALHSFIQPLHLPFHRLHTLNGMQFDGGYSNFGGLNCTNKLDRVAADLAALIKGDKYFVLCLMSDFSLWETISFTVRGKWAQAFRRKSPFGVLADVKGEKVWVHYYPPETVHHIFAPHFDLVEMKGLNIFSPPPTSRTAHRVFGRTWQLIESIEDSLPSYARPHRWGDHIVYVFRRRGSR
jgi:hypothetical protein